MTNVHIEYCEKWNYYPEFERVSNIIKKENAELTITQNDTPPRTGSFEVTIDDNVVYSKFKTNNFPTEDEILGWIKS